LFVCLSEDDVWQVNWKGFVRASSQSNPSYFQALTWKCCGRPRKTCQNNLSRSRFEPSISSTKAYSITATLTDPDAIKSGRSLPTFRGNSLPVSERLKIKWKTTRNAMKLYDGAEARLHIFTSAQDGIEWPGHVPAALPR
jgi:hypothetical protein